uniref:Pseudouridine synthase RsuA/RluA-like domain-containing protein n=1 Tax=Entomoneis paludosa TaxID=265537 RepID=A0A7S2YFR3_9STRA
MNYNDMMQQQHERQRREEREGNHYHNHNDHDHDEDPSQNKKKKKKKPKQAQPCSLRWKVVGSEELNTLYHEAISFGSGQDNSKEATTTTTTTASSVSLDPSFVMLHVETQQGRRHMIRALLGQVAYCPIVGDFRYANNHHNNDRFVANGGEQTIPMPDQSVALHAAQLTLPPSLQLGQPNQKRTRPTVVPESESVEVNDQEKDKDGKDDHEKDKDGKDDQEKDKEEKVPKMETNTEEAGPNNSTPLPVDPQPVDPQPDTTTATPSIPLAGRTITAPIPFLWVKYFFQETS